MNKRLSLLSRMDAAQIKLGARPKTLKELHEYLTLMYQRMLALSLSLLSQRAFFNSQNNISDLTEKALIILSFFRDIKRMQANATTGAGIQELENVGLMQALGSLNGGRLMKDPLFLSMFGDRLSANQGFDLEHGIARVIKTLELFMTDGIDYESKDSASSLSLVGTQTILPAGLSSIPNKIASDYTLALYNKMYYYYDLASLESRVYRNKNNSTFAAYVNVSGKPDNLGLNPNITFGIKTFIDPKLITALQGATFTAKNYRLWGNFTSSNVLHFGATNIFRVFMTAAEGDPRAIEYYETLINSNYEQSSYLKNANLRLFYRIRAIYELTGIGSKYSNSNFAVGWENPSLAQYLVWNNPLDPSGESIRVIPTALIILNLVAGVGKMLLPNNWKDALYGGIDFALSDLANLAD